MKRHGILWPGEPNALYHSEGVHEGFLVLSGECVVIVEEEERPQRQWGLLPLSGGFQCPAETRHVIVGAGNGPCRIPMLGARPGVETIHYPVSTLAAKYGASASTRPPNRGVRRLAGRVHAGAAAVAGRRRYEAVTVS